MEYLSTTYTWIQRLDLTLYTHWLLTVNNASFGFYWRLDSRGQEPHDPPPFTSYPEIAMFYFYCSCLLTLETSHSYSKRDFFISSMLLALTIITGLAGIGTSANNLVQQDQILKAIQKLSATLTNHTQTLHYILSLTQQQHGSLAQLMMDNHLVFDFLMNEMESALYRTFLVSSTLTIQDRYRPTSPEDISGYTGHA